MNNNHEQFTAFDIQFYSRDQFRYFCINNKENCDNSDTSYYLPIDYTIYIHNILYTYTEFFPRFDIMGLKLMP